MSFGSFLKGAVHVVTAPVKAVVNTAEHVVSDAGHVASDIGHAAKSVVNFGTHTVENAASSVVHGVANGAHSIFSLGLHQGQAIGSALGHAGWNIGKTFGHDASSAFSTVTHGVTQLGHEFGHTVSNVGSAIGHGASAIGGGFIHTAGDIFGTAGKLGGDVIHTAGNIGGDIFHTAGDLTHGHFGAAFGHFGHIGKDVLSGAGHVATDAAHGAANVAGDIGHEVAGIGHAFAEGGGALASGALQMGGTVLGAAGELAKNYEHAMGTLLTNAVDSVGAIAKGEVAFGYGTAGIIAHTVGTPLGDFYANVAKHYGDAAIGTLDHVNNAIDGAVNKATTYGGDLAKALGHGADTVGHDGGQVISDISHGNFSAAAHDFGQLGSDLLEAGKQLAGAEKEGIEALAAVANGINTTLNGLNEAMARAGGGFVSAVGDTIGGHAGHMISDAGDGLGKATAMTADLVQGNFEGAAKEGAKELGGLAGEWVGEQVKHAFDDLGNKVGGVFGDGLKALGGFAADELKDLGKTAAGAAADKGLDMVKGGDDHSPSTDKTGDGSHSQTTDHAANNDSLLDKVLHAAEQAKDDAIHKATDLLDKVTHDPQVLLNLAADALKDHLVKDPSAALDKLFAAAANAGSHGHTDAHAADGTTGTSHAALTADTHAPTFAGDSVESLFAQHNAAGATGSYDAPTTLQDVLRGISILEHNPNLLSALLGAQSGHVSEASFFSGHDLMPAHQPDPAVPHFDGGMLVHSDLATSHSEHAHQLFG